MDDEIIREFLIESNEGLARLEQELVALERQPDDADLLASIFRTVHTIKGTCGFLGFDHLGRITHITEHILSQLRARELSLSAHLTGLILESVDAIKAVLEVIASTGTEGRETYGNLCARLKRASDEGKQPGSNPARAETVCLQTQSLATPLMSAEPSTRTERIEQSGLKPLSKNLHRPVHSAIPAGKGISSAADSTMRVEVALMDHLMSLVGELGTVENEIRPRRGCNCDPPLASAAQRLSLITSELRHALIKARMQSVSVICSKLPRLVRDLSGDCGKQIELEMEGIETELDKVVIEAIRDPITHLVRNCCDHGIEDPDTRVACGKAAKGKLSVRVFQRGGGVDIDIQDDGRGIDVEKLRQRAFQNGLLHSNRAANLSGEDALQLVFLPGFSTAEYVSTISGRGVGMDVVKTNVERIGGQVQVSTQPGKGTTVRISVPITLTTAAPSHASQADFSESREVMCGSCM